MSKTTRRKDTKRKHVEFLKQLQPFQIKNPYIVVTGSVYYGTPHDLDFMIFTPLKLKDDPIAAKVKQKLEQKYLPPYVHWSNAFYTTPFSPYLPVYDLELTPVFNFLTRGKYAPMYPKDSTEPAIQIPLRQILTNLPSVVPVQKKFIYYTPHMFYIPLETPVYYYVPLYLRLTRMFPPENRPEVVKTDRMRGIPVYNLVLRKRKDLKWIEM